MRYNHFHDQLVLTSSSDSRVILICVAGISSEPGGHMIIGDDANESPKEKFVLLQLWYFTTVGLLSKI